MRTWTRGPRRRDGTAPMAARAPRRADGQILALFAISLVTIILFTGLVIDGGGAFLSRREAQNISDTASLAGTKVLLDHYTVATKQSSDVYLAIDRNVTVSNGCTASGGTPCIWTASYVDRFENVLGPVSITPSSIPNGAQGVVVTIARQPRTYFLGVIGQTTWNVSAKATAMTAGLNSGPPGVLLPIATNPPQPFVPGQPYTLTDVGSAPGNSPQFGPGNFGWLSWFGTNDAVSLANSICNPNNPAFTMPYTFPGDSGATNSSGVRACLDGWVTRGTTVLIPVATSCNPCNGSGAQFNVTKVAAFVLTGYTASGPAISSLTGSFVEYYPLPSVPGGYGAPPNAGDPAYFVGLIR